MTDHNNAHHDEPSSSLGSFWTSRALLVCVALLAISGFLLLTEHRAHILGGALWLLLLACPLLHMFMHGRHGGHAGHGGRGRPKTGPGANPGVTGKWNAPR